MSNKTKMTSMNNIKISPLLTLWLPVGFLVLDIVLENILPRNLVTWFMSEQGPVELGQSVIMWIALFYALSILPKLDFKTQKYLCLWVAIAALGSLYVAGEELSWGQQLLHWQTPSEWASVNDQDETNLHNTSSWLDQKPRLILEIGVLIGGLIVPAVRRFKPAWLPARFEPVYPPDAVFLTALFVWGVKLVNCIDKAIPATLFERGSEMQETYLFYFVLLYLIFLRRRVLQGIS